MKKKLWKFAVIGSLLLFVAFAAILPLSFNYSYFIRVLTSKPALLPITSSEQQAASDNLLQTRGWDGLYRVRYLASLFSGGSWYFFWGFDGQFVIDRNIPPPRFIYGSDASRALFVNNSAALTLLSPAMPLTNISVAGFSYFHLQLPAGSDNYRLGVPIWFIGLLALILPSIALSKWLKARRQKMIGLCPKCGYDLRATPDRCPECGTPAASSTS